MVIPVPWEVDRFAMEGKSKLAKWPQDVMAVTCDCPTTCVFIPRMTLRDTATRKVVLLMEVVTGSTMSPKKSGSPM